MNESLAFAFYGLTHNPFDKGNSFTFKSIDYQEMTARLTQVVEQRGIGLYTGASGVGKSRILHQFLKGLNTNLYKCCELKETRISSNEFYRELAIELGLEPSYKKAVNFRQIQTRICQLAAQQIIPVFVIDEAQFLSLEIFQEFILLLNFQQDTVRNTVVLLTGTSGLLDKLRYASLEALRQRVLSIYHCEGLQAQEAHAYLEAKLKSAEGDLQLLVPNAIELLLGNARGSLRRLDTLAMKAIEIGAQQKQMPIELSTVEAATQEILF